MARRRPRESTESSTKICFVICPIGEENSDVRVWSDTVLNHIIKPIAESEKYGYKVVRADLIPTPGMITTQIIEYLLSSDLVIADLSFKNPNVFYELAVRHAVRKPYIQMINKDERVPFDIGGNRTILFNTDIKYADKAKSELDHHIESIVKGSFEIDNPIGTAIDFMNLKSSGNVEQISIATILQNLSEMKSQMTNLNQKIDEQSKTQKNFIPSNSFGDYFENKLLDEYDRTFSNLKRINKEIEELQRSPKKTSQYAKRVKFLEIQKSELLSQQKKVKNQLSNDYGVIIST
jgi:hypothetical protein